MRCGLSDQAKPRCSVRVVVGYKLYSVTVCYTVTAVVSLNDYNWSVGCVFIICSRTFARVHTGNASVQDKVPDEQLLGLFSMLTVLVHVCGQQGCHNPTSIRACSLWVLPCGYSPFLYFWDSSCGILMMNASARIRFGAADNGKSKFLAMNPSEYPRSPNKVQIFGQNPCIWQPTVHGCRGLCLVC